MSIWSHHHLHKPNFYVIFEFYGEIDTLNLMLANIFSGRHIEMLPDGARSNQVGPKKHHHIGGERSSIVCAGASIDCDVNTHS